MKNFIMILTCLGVLCLLSQGSIISKFGFHGKPLPAAEVAIAIAVVITVAEAITVVETVKVLESSTVTDTIAVALSIGLAVVITVMVALKVGDSVQVVAAPASETTPTFVFLPPDAPMGVATETSTMPNAAFSR